VIKALASKLPGETSQFDAQILLSHITGHNRAWLISHPETELTIEQAEKLEQAIQELQKGMPLPYVLGRWAFFGLEFFITPSVLIPRPETELLVETALAYVRHHPLLNYRVMDIGTGSGIIPISLAAHIPHATFLATDISPEAIKVAQKNAERNGVEKRIHFQLADLLSDDMLLSEYNIICANLPYIPSETLKTLEVNKNEPTIALDGGYDGLSVIQKLFSQFTNNRPSENSLLLFEIEYRQGKTVYDMAIETFPFAKVHIQRDLAGLDRLIVINT